MRIAVIDKEKCKPKKCGYVCIKNCPGVRMREETITIDESTKYPIIDENLCTGCGICVKKCPQDAIDIVNLPEELKNPVHQYGPNGFRVYSLPTIREENTVGFIGPNGCGKTTILNILSGNLVPNLGRGNTQIEKVVEEYKGKEIQNWLIMLKEHQVTVSYKPQNVDEIPQHHTGKVQKLLSKLGGQKTIREISGKLGILETLDRDIKKISGGELQRVAIAACFLKQADLYCFDEPASYLDVGQRLKVAKLIHELSEKKPVIIIEHDLAVLDYLSDYVHVFYGKPGTYGIVSGLKSVRVGINEFLEGYLKAENTRFRDKEIKFYNKPPVSTDKGTPVEYPALEKKFPGFSLKTQGGFLRLGEVVGILGPNATGKTTFIKMLAGIEKPDNTKLSLKLSLSYKPQYVHYDYGEDSETTVSEHFAKIKKDPEFFETELKPMVSELWEKNVSKLSGGEQQRVAIVECLAKDAEMYLLDEPSAFLDIEQRLQTSRLIRRNTEKREAITLVVDHDLLFQDYISNRLMVFEGTPSKNGYGNKATDLRSGMNKFLEQMNITLRRDKESNRPRINKPGSQLDEKQRKQKEYYYT